jgi:hypothetical protein
MNILILIAIIAGSIGLIVTAVFFLALYITDFTGIDFFDVPEFKDDSEEIKFLKENDMFDDTTLLITKDTTYINKPFTIKK